MPVPGIGGHAFIDLEPYVDLRALEALDDEIAYGLTQVPLEYTGGSHKSMGIVPPSLAQEPYADYGQVIARFSREEFVRFVSLGDTPGEFDPDRRAEYEFGEEREWPLNKRQMLFLKFKLRRLLPVEGLLRAHPDARLGGQGQRRGQGLHPPRRGSIFPRLVAFVERLPFEAVGRCNILGLEANDHGTVHHDGDPDDPVAEPLHHALPAQATSASSCGTRRRGRRGTRLGAPTGSTTTATTASSRTRSSATRSASMASSGRTS